MFDSHHIGQPGIIENPGNARLTAPRLSNTVGPELFYVSLILLEETGYFNARCITLPYQAWKPWLWLVEQTRSRYGKDPAYVVAYTGGSVPTARGEGRRQVQDIGASVILQGFIWLLIMISIKSLSPQDIQGSVPFTTWPDRTDVPKMPQALNTWTGMLVTQGEVFYVTELWRR